jgi:hypothetical protein
MTLTLPDRPAKYFINEILVPSWDADAIATAKGYDLSASPADEAFLPVATTIDDVGAVYPSLIIQYSNETSGGESTYDYLTPNGPGQNRTGTLLAVVRAQEAGDGYTGDAAQHDPEPADDIGVHILEAVENICQRNAGGGSSQFQSLGSQRGPDATDDDDENPTVRIDNRQIIYSWLRQP